MKPSRQLILVRLVGLIEPPCASQLLRFVTAAQSAFIADFRKIMAVIEAVRLDFRHRPYKCQINKAVAVDEHKLIDDWCFIAYRCQIGTSRKDTLPDCCYGT